MVKSWLIVFFVVILNIFPALAQDTLNYNGKHYQFIKGATDTAQTQGGGYIIKYVTEPDEADVMRSNGKIYVVIMVLATIFAGIIAYLIYLDRKISRLEKESRS